MEETGETAQVKSKKSNEGIIASNPDSFVLHALHAHESRDFFGTCRLRGGRHVVLFLIRFWKRSPRVCFVLFIWLQILTSVYLKRSVT